MPGLVLVVFIDGSWRIEPADDNDGCEGDEYCITAIPEKELMAAFEKARQAQT